MEENVPMCVVTGGLDRHKRVWYIIDIYYVCAVYTHALKSK